MNSGNRSRDDGQEKILCLGRDAELEAIRDLILDKKPQRALGFVGAPQIGKTTLLRKAREEILHLQPTETGAERVLPVLLRWPKDMPTLGWNAILNRLHAAVSSSTKEYKKVTRLLGEYQANWSPPRLPDLFERLDQELAGIRLIFLIDDFDRAFSTEPSQQDATGLVWPGDILEWAQHPNVRLVFTTSRSLWVEFGNSFREKWLYLLDEGNARMLAQELLGLSSSDDEAVSEAVKWAGYHPLLLATLTPYVRRPSETQISKSDISRAVRSWRQDQEVQAHLKAVWEELDLAHEPRAAVMLRRMLSGEEIRVPTPAEESGIWYLSRHGVATRDVPYKIPSKLFQEFASKQLGVVRITDFTVERLIWLSFISFFLCLTISLILFSVGYKPYLGLIPAPVPLLYAIYGLSTQR